MDFESQKVMDATNAENDIRNGSKTAKPSKLLKRTIFEVEDYNKV